MENLQKTDAEVYEWIQKELTRQRNHIELIASENYVSKAVLEAQGSILTNKYAEGYYQKRYYDGCEFIDEIEKTAIRRACFLFGCKYANVQPHSGSSANMAVYEALLSYGDVILGMSLDAGGHLTHGFSKSFSGKRYTVFSYGVNEEGYLDYEAIRQMALKVRPKLIIAGASAYPRIIDFAKFREIADEVSAYLMVDMAHIAGLVAAGQHPSPFPYADVVTTTTHKTLRGPRGGMILSDKEEIAKKIDSAVFPGIQGGPLMHVIAAKAVALKEASEPSFRKDMVQVVRNCKTMAEELQKRGYHLISGGTDNHLLLVDVYKSVGITGKEASSVLNSVGITCNKNSIPNDRQKTSLTSGIRLGTAAVTTRGMKENEMIRIVDWIDRTLCGRNQPDVLRQIREEVESFMRNFPYLEDELPSGQQTATKRIEKQ